VERRISAVRRARILYAIKMDADKNLVTTVRSTIFRGENNADTLVFLLPQIYETIDLSACTILLRYILPDGTGMSEELERRQVPYNDDYYKYRLRVASRFTETPGDIELWLTAIGFDDDVVLKTGETSLTISPSKNITDSMSPDSIDQIDRLASMVRQLDRDKADNIVFDSDDRIIQLTSNGEPIGTEIVI
jgi:hypothetical protein